MPRLVSGRFDAGIMCAIVVVVVIVSIHWYSYMSSKELKVLSSAG